MIEINLLPQELRITRKSSPIDLKSAPYIIGAIFSIVILAHIILIITFLFKSYSLHRIENNWKILEPDRRLLESLKREYTTAVFDSKVIQEIMAQRVNWPEKLNKLSLYLPSGVWFEEVSFLNKDFRLRGSVVSLQKEEINLINNFVESLKKDNNFFAGFNSLELGSMQRKTIGSYDVVDFILTGKLK